MVFPKDVALERVVAGARGTRLSRLVLGTVSPPAAVEGFAFNGFLPVVLHGFLLVFESVRRNSL